MTAWPIINMTSSLIVAAIVAYKLGWKPDRFSFMERGGMSLVGAGCILTIGPILYVEPTPYEDWSGTLLRIGCAVYFLGRLLKHRHANAAAIRQARAHLRDR